MAGIKMEVASMRCAGKITYLFKRSIDAGKSTELEDSNIPIPSADRQTIFWTSLTHLYKE